MTLPEQHELTKVRFAGAKLCQGSCPSPPPAAVAESAIGAALAGGLIDLMTRWWAIDQQEKFEELKRRSLPPEYSAKQVLDGGAFKQPVCLELQSLVKPDASSEGASDEVGLLVKITIKPDQVDQRIGELKITRLEVRRSIAFVAKPGSGDIQASKTPGVDLVLSFAIKSVGFENGETTVASHGAATLTLRNVPFEQNFCTVPSRCENAAQFISLPSDASFKRLVVTAAVAEVGKPGFDLDIRKAQINALREALGPALVEAVKIRLTPPPPPPPSDGG